MSLSDLSKEDKSIVHACLRCVASGEVILHDWEFQTLFGVGVDEFIRIVESWPNLDDSQGSVSEAINNSMNNLLGYPHSKIENWDDFMPYPRSEVERMFREWKGD